MKKIHTVILASILSITTAMAQEIYDFDSGDVSNHWYVVDDVVMGGRSEGSLALSEEGHGIFQGKVSLENNGGFSSVRYRPESLSATSYSSFRIRVKGDGKSYQFRVKSKLSERQSYVYEFESTGSWQEISIPFREMYPSFRGNRLSMPNYPGEEVRECVFLIANNKNETFRLEIDRIWME